MRKLKIMEHISLDGVIQISAGPKADSDFPYGDWTAPYRSPAGFALVTQMYGETFDLVIGRRTYDQWSSFWPKAPRSPMADRLNANEVCRNPPAGEPGMGSVRGHWTGPREERS